MIGAIAGDVIGSRYEFVQDFRRPKNFTLFTPACRPTDDSYMTLAVAKALVESGGDRDKLGRGCVWEGQISPCLHQNHVFALTTNEELNIYYVDYLTTSDVGRNYFDFTAKKTTNLASTNATTILAFQIPIPCRKEQDEIVSYLRKKCAEVDSIISANETIIAKLKEYRQSVIYEAVTGKIEV